MVCINFSGSNVLGHQFNTKVSEFSLKFEICFSFSSILLLGLIFLLQVDLTSFLASFSGRKVSFCMNVSGILYLTTHSF